MSLPDLLLHFRYLQIRCLAHTADNVDCYVICELFRLQKSSQITPDIRKLVFIILAGFLLSVKGILIHSCSPSIDTVMCKLVLSLSAVSHFQWRL